MSEEVIKTEEIKPVKKPFSGLMRSKFAGVCQECGEDYRIGNMIFVIGSRGSGALHMRCKKERDRLEYERSLTPEYIKTRNDAEIAREAAESERNAKWRAIYDDEALARKEARKEKLGRLKIGYKAAEKRVKELEGENALLKDDNEILVARCHRLQKILKLAPQTEAMEEAIRENISKRS